MPIQSLSHMSNFKSTIDDNGGPANPSRFMFVIGGFPTVLKSQPKYASVAPTFLRTLQFLCETTDLPGLTIHTNQRTGYSPAMTPMHPTQMEYQPVTLSVICRDYMKEKEFFDDWMFAIKNAFSSQRNGGVGGSFDNAYYNEYVVNGGIYLLSNYGNLSDSDSASVAQTRYAIQLVNMFPTSIDSIQLAWSEESLMRLNITMSYSVWEPIQGASLYAHTELGISKARSPDSQLSNSTNTPRNPTQVKVI